MEEKPASPAEPHVHIVDAEYVQVLDYGGSVILHQSVTKRFAVCLEFTRSHLRPDATKDNPNKGDVDFTIELTGGEIFDLVHALMRQLRTSGKLLMTAAAEELDKQAKKIAEFKAAINADPAPPSQP